MKRTAAAAIFVVLLGSSAIVAANDLPVVEQFNEILDLERDPFEGPQQSIGVSVAPTFSVGSASAYFSPGGKLRFAYAMEFALDWALLRPGFSIGTQYMYAEGTARSSHMLLVPVAAETSLVFLQNNPVQPSVALRAGAAYLALLPASEDAVAKVVPYVGTEAGVSFVRPNGIRLTGTIGLDLYAEATMLVWLLSPGFQIEFSL